MFAKALLLGACAAALAAAQSSVLSFTRVPNPMTDGEAQAILYMTNDTSTPVTILLRKGPSNNLQTVETLTTKATNGQFIWTPPVSLADGTDYALEIKQGTQINYFGPFQIQGANPAAVSSASSSAVSSSATSSASASTSGAALNSTSSGSSSMSSTMNSTATGVAGGTHKSSKTTVTTTASSNSSSTSMTMTTTSSARSTTTVAATTASATTASATMPAQTSTTSTPSSDAAGYVYGSFALGLGAVAAFGYLL